MRCAAKAALQYHLDGFRGQDMLPLLLYEMATVVEAHVRRPLGITTLMNDVDTDRDYNRGLQDVRSQRKAHWIETHASIAMPGGAAWDCASMDGYMCECRPRNESQPARRARRCRVANACFDEQASAGPQRRARGQHEVLSTRRVARPQGQAARDTRGTAPSRWERRHRARPDALL